MESEFRDQARRVAEKFSREAGDKPVRLISHFDADGICSASILASGLRSAGISYHLSMVKQLSDEVLSTFRNEPYEIYLFADLGSGQYSQIMNRFPDKLVFILDHHPVAKNLAESGSITMLNPHMAGVDGSKLISGAGVAFFFSEALDTRNRKLAHLALIGAIGDSQENNGFDGLNAGILASALEQGIIKKESSIRWFGIETRPILNLLAYNTDLTIPGVTGSESDSAAFLNQLGIEPKIENRWKLLGDLTGEEVKKLIAGIVMRRSSEKEPENILGQRYIIVDEEEKSLFRDAKEFATLLNACGRMGKPYLGLGACLKDSLSRAGVLELANLYKQELINSLRWYESQKKAQSPYIVSGKGYLIINAVGNIKATVIGTLASIISKSGELPDGSLIMSLAHDEGGITKVSVRSVGEPPLDIREIISALVGEVGGEGGGHRNAAGAIIKTENEDLFIKAAIRIFEKPIL